VKINNLDTCCEQVGRRGKDCETIMTINRPSTECHLYSLATHSTFKKAVPVKAVKTYRVSRGITPRFLNLATKFGRLFNFTPQPVYPRECAAVPTQSLNKLKTYSLQSLGKLGIPFVVCL
jgi:hypothetical protein